MFSLSVLVHSGLFISDKIEGHGKVPDPVSAEDLKSARMIQYFKARGESQLKSGEEMSVDCVSWNLSSTVNFTL